MSFELEKYCQIMRVNSDDTLGHLRKLLSPYIYNWTFNYFERTRNYELGLSFIGLCYLIISMNRTAISEEEYAVFDRDLIYGKLSMLDGLNRWQEYIATFDFARKTKNYTFCYKSSAFGIGGNALDDGSFSEENSYILYTDGEYTYVHFLYSISHRYEIIQRKFQRLVNGESTKHLEKHSSDLLTDYELERRLAELSFKLSKIITKYNLEW